MLDLNIHISDEQIKHIEESKNKKTFFCRFKSISHVSNPQLAQYIQDNCDTSNVKKCGFCGSVKKIIDYDLKFVNNRIFLDNIKYSNQALICSRKDTDVTKNCRSHALNSNSIEFVKVAYGFKNDEEANEYILNRNSSPFYKHNHDSIEEYKKYQTRDLEWFGCKHKFKEYEELRRFALSRENLINIYGEDGYKEINKSKDSMSINYCKTKYGDKWEEHYSKRCNEVKTTRENFITRYGEINGNIKWNEYIENLRKKSIEYFNSLTISERSLIFDTTSKESFKRRFKDDWEDKYKAHQKKIQTPAQRASKESLCFFNKLLDKISHLNLNYNLGVDGNSEWFIYDKENKKFNLYDFCIKELNVIIEYHGSIWHYNPNYEYKGKLPFGMTVEENIKKDVYKQELAVYNGFKYFVVFDTDDHEQKSNELAKIIEGLANEQTV